MKRDSSAQSKSSQDEKLARHKECIAAFDDFVERNGLTFTSKPLPHMLCFFAFVDGADAVDYRDPSESIEQAKSRALLERMKMIDRLNAEHGNPENLEKRASLDLMLLTMTASGAEWAANNPIKK